MNILSNTTAIAQAQCSLALAELQAGLWEKGESDPDYVKRDASGKFSSSNGGASVSKASQKDDVLDRAADALVDKLLPGLSPEVKTKVKTTAKLAAATATLAATLLVTHGAGRAFAKQAEKLTKLAGEHKSLAKQILTEKGESILEHYSPKQIARAEKVLRDAKGNLDHARTLAEIKWTDHPKSVVHRSGVELDAEGRIVDGKDLIEHWEQEIKKAKKHVEDVKRRLDYADKHKEIEPVKGILKDMAKREGHEKAADLALDNAKKRLADSKTAVNIEENLSMVAVWTSVITTASAIDAFQAGLAAKEPPQKD